MCSIKLTRVNYIQNLYHWLRTPASTKWKNTTRYSNLFVQPWIKQLSHITCVFSKTTTNHNKISPHINQLRVQSHTITHTKIHQYALVHKIVRYKPSKFTSLKKLKYVFHKHTQTFVTTLIKTLHNFWNNEKLVTQFYQNNRIGTLWETWWNRLQATVIS